MSVIGTVFDLAGVEANGAVVASNGPLGTANNFWWGIDTSNSAALYDKTGIRPLCGARPANETDHLDAN